MKKQSAVPHDVHNITDAHTSHTDEMRERMIKYAVAMGIRMVCLILVFVLDGWFKLLAVAGAVFLPWFAVIIANGGSDTLNEHSTALLDSAPLAELTSGEAEDAPEADGSDVLQGEVVSDDGAGQARGEGSGAEGSGAEAPGTDGAQVAGDGIPGAGGDGRNSEPQAAGTREPTRDGRKA